MLMKIIFTWGNKVRNCQSKILWKFLFQNLKFSWTRCCLLKKKGSWSRRSKFVSKGQTRSKNLKIRAPKKSKIVPISTIRKSRYLRQSCKKLLRKMSSRCHNFWNRWPWSQDWPIFCYMPWVWSTAIKSLMIKFCAKTFSREFRNIWGQSDIMATRHSWCATMAAQNTPRRFQESAAYTEMFTSLMKILRFKTSKSRKM